MAGNDLQCPHCRQTLEMPLDAGRRPLVCPACHQELPGPEPPAAAMAPASAPPTVADLAVRCAICLSPLTPGEERHTCPDCHAEYHADCWQENRGCAVYGCPQVPAVEHRQAVEIPVSYWGQENKPCPGCGREILAAAVRCRHCGATFTSARPEDAAAFQQRAELTQRLPAARRTALWLFIVSVLPCSAPAGAVWGAVWYPRHRAELSALPSLYPALCKIGLGVAISQTVALVVMACLYVLLRAS